MLLFSLAVALCSYNQIALEYGKVPITRVGTDGKGVKQNICSRPALQYKDNILSLSKDIIPERAHNFHLFLESEFEFEKQSFVKVSDDKVMGFSTLESQIDRNSLLSLYFDTLISKNYQIVPGSTINVSSRDYFTEEQNKDLAKVFASMGYKVKVIPESLAACIQNVEFGVKDGIKNSYYINFKGSKVVGTLYEIKSENDVISITMIETKELDLKSDFEYEKAVANLIIKEVKGNQDISFLPYEICDKSSYASIDKLVTDYLRDIKSALDKFDILEVNCFNRKTGAKIGSISDKSVDFDTIREDLKSSMQLDALLQNLPENTEKFIISDIPYREEFGKNFTLVSWDFISKGLYAAHGKKINFTDFRVLSNTYGEFSPIYMLVKSEIDLKFEIVNEMIPMIHKTLEQYKYVTETEKSKLLELISEDKPKTIKLCKEIKTVWESIQKLNSKREADIICREDDIKLLENAIKEAKKLLGGLVQDNYKDFVLLYEETLSWLKDAKANTESTGFIVKATKLMAFTNFITNSLKKAEEKRIADEIKALEDLKKEEDKTAENEFAEDQQKNDLTEADAENKSIDENEVKDELINDELFEKAIEEAKIKNDIEDSQFEIL